MFESRIPPVDPASSSGLVKELFERVRARLGAVPESIQVLANSPAAFAAWWEFQVQLEDSELVRQQVAVLAADVDQCGYRLGTTSTNSAAALEFAAAVVTGRGAISKDAIAAAHAGGLSDTQLIEVVAVVTLNTFLTVCGRLANPEAEPTSVGAEDDFIAMRGGSLIRHPWWLAGG